MHYLELPIIVIVVGGPLLSKLPKNLTVYKGYWHEQAVAGCYPELNPDVPDLVLPGSGPQIEDHARIPQQQRHNTNIRELADNKWIYVGMDCVKEFLGRSERDRQAPRQGECSRKERQRAGQNKMVL
jgi:hypothetical protein